ncbi:MAG: PAS domain S-box protein, partial [Gemmataceae bacterium]|nr:PAS domain S-box protein [Gemmataceae bacterium]
VAHVVKFPMRGPGGDPQVGGVAIDITTRTRAEDALRASEERFKTLASSAPVGIFETDRAGGCLFVNARWCELTGLSHEQAAGAGWAQALHPDDRDRVAVAWAAAVGRGGEFALDYRFRRPDGRVAWVSGSAVALREPGGDARGYLGTVTDITARKAAEEALRGSEERLRAAMDASLDAVYFLTAARGPDGAVADFVFAELNGRGADLLSRTREQVLGRRLCELLPVNRTAGFFDKYARVAETGEPLEEEFAVDPADGLRASWLRHQVVKVGVGVAITTQDITARKRAEEQVRASLGEKEVMLKEIHHRVKNNLQIVSALLELQARHAGDPAVLGLFAESRARVRSMALIHERLYRSSDLARVDFAEYVRQLARDLYRAYRVELDVDVPPLPVDVAIPCGLLLNELMSNCLKHAFRGRPTGVLRVAFHQAAGGVHELRVADDGLGLPPGFDLTRAESFGLQLVVTLAEQLGGEVEVTGGPGTAFAVRFPARPT